MTVPWALRGGAQCARVMCSWVCFQIRWPGLTNRPRPPLHWPLPPFSYRGSSEISKAWWAEEGFLGLWPANGPQILLGKRLGDDPPSWSECPLSTSSPPSASRARGGTRVL